MTTHDVSGRQGFCDRCGKYATFPSWRETVCWRCAFGARLTEHRDRDRKATHV